MLKKIIELMNELYNKDRIFFLEYMASLLGDCDNIHKDYETRLRQLFLIEAYLLDQNDNDKRLFFLTNLNRIKQIILNEVISNKISNEVKRYILLWATEDYRDDEEWIAICFSQKELNEQIEEQRKKIESYDEFLKRAYAPPVKLLAYEYIPKQGFKRVNLEAVSSNNCES